MKQTKTSRALIARIPLPVSELLTVLPLCVVLVMAAANT